MYSVAIIGSIAFGILALAVAIWHECSWWKRRHWTRAQGFIVGFSVSYDEGTRYYHSEIEYYQDQERKTFVSIYGSPKKAVTGSQVEIIVSDEGDGVEQWSISNRVLFTIVPILFGVLFILLGLNIQPLKAEQDGWTTTNPDEKKQAEQVVAPDGE